MIITIVWSAQRKGRRGGVYHESIRGNTIADDPNNVGAKAGLRIERILGSTNYREVIAYIVDGPTQLGVLGCKCSERQATESNVHPYHNDLTAMDDRLDILPRQFVSTANDAVSADMAQAVNKAMKAAITERLRQGRML